VKHRGEKQNHTFYSEVAIGKAKKLQFRKLSVLHYQQLPSSQVKRRTFNFV